MASFHSDHVKKKKHYQDYFHYHLHGIDQPFIKLDTELLDSYSFNVKKFIELINLKQENRVKTLSIINDIIKYTEHSNLLKFNILITSINDKLKGINFYAYSASLRSNGDYNSFEKTVNIYSILLAPYNFLKITINHELAHANMDYLLDNKSNPYNNDTQKNYLKI